MRNCALVLAEAIMAPVCPENFQANLDVDVFRRVQKFTKIARYSERCRSRRLDRGLKLGA